MGQIGPPEPIADRHDVHDFDSGEPALDEWLSRRANANQISGASRTYVAIDESTGAVAGYYALSSGAFRTDHAPGRFKRNMPNPIPVAVLARLAVDRRYQGQGLGGALFRDACVRVSAAAEIIGIRGILVHAISERAKSFYVALGFTPSKNEPLTLLLTLSEIQSALAQE